VRVVAVTGAGSGIGAATAARLTDEGCRVIGVDLRGAEIEADLGTAGGRQAAIDAVTEASGGTLDGLITCAGVTGLPGRPASVLASVNYFGTVVVMEGLRPLLAKGDRPSAVAISSNSTTTAPGFSMELVEALLAGDEAHAREVADRPGMHSMLEYGATKLAVARWVRRNAVTEQWGRAGIRLNAVAPGMIATPMVQEGMDNGLADQLEMFRQTIAFGRAGEADEVAALLAFLVGTDSTFFCGSVIFCDGGTDALVRADDFPAPWQPR
jgi:NAD(P)-dependent dehydrogenase (short-subunit alcohol dehydrogenase family)